MADISGDLGSFSFEAELTEEEEGLLHLRARSAGLTFCGCAHAAFLCKLVQSLSERGGRGWRAHPVEGWEDEQVRGQDDVTTCEGTEALEAIKKGVECFFDNGRLAAWADLLFLCCLPSDLHKVCADLHSRLSKHCLVYSFTSGVPVTRLARLLGHDFILKPQYDFIACGNADVWLTCTHLTTALADPSLIEASCPLTTRGGISVGLNWVSAVLYSLLNICTSAGLGSSDALSLINTVLKEESPHAVQLDELSFISASQEASMCTEE
ncbi:NADP-dependent oxidoreductase domain-containing protein 1 [Liparis tanakae]|uniref:NADP-dependent oxidoreductase domain-containing protein 1 n=1 Tax=Liparis tanakae TaxID=230148 RepID=A0A4Z2GTD8_9TELE|nr:NADP-dependent oxidoreductase domain-containing protein 1 [Liparis tanakae]